MDKKLGFTVLFVMLSFMGTYAQTTTTTARTTITTAPTTTTTAPTTTTTAPMTTTTAPMTTTTAPMTTTTAPTTITTAPTTTATPIMSVCPVAQSSVNRSGCQTQKLCAAEPSGCDPSTDSSCFFTAARQNSGQNFTFELSGISTGFIAIILSTDTTAGGNDTAYVCANNKGTLDIRSALLSTSNTLITTTLNTTCVSGVINGDRIQCTFNATIPDSTARTTSFSLSVVNGTFNSTSGGLGNTSAILRSPVVNLAQTNVNVTNVLNNSTATTTTPATTPTTASTNTAHAITLQQSVMQALLFTVAALGLSTL